MNEKDLIKKNEYFSIKEYLYGIMSIDEKLLEKRQEDIAYHLYVIEEMEEDEDYENLVKELIQIIDYDLIVKTMLYELPQTLMLNAVIYGFADDFKYIREARKKIEKQKKYYK